MARAWLHLAEEVEAVGHQGDEGELDDEVAMVAGARARKEGGEREVAVGGEHLTRGKEVTEAGLAGNVAARGRRRRPAGTHGVREQQGCSGAALEHGLAGRSGGRVAGQGEVEEAGGSRQAKGRALGEREGEEEIEQREMGIGAPGGAGGGIEGESEGIGRMLGLIWG